MFAIEYLQLSVLSHDALPPVAPHILTSMAHISALNEICTFCPAKHSGLGHDIQTQIVPPMGYDHGVTYLIQGGMTAIATKLAV